MNAVIGAGTRLNVALGLHPDVLEYIVSLEPHDFARLQNPVMCRLMSPRITLGRVAVMAGVPVSDVLERIAMISGASIDLNDTASSLPASEGMRPDWVGRAEQGSFNTVNLLPMDDALDGDPMIPVAKAIRLLEPGGVLLIRHRWEPQPFYDIWNRMQGIEWFSEPDQLDGWHIWVRRKPRA
jgi:hypothetical protein